MHVAQPSLSEEVSKQLKEFNNIFEEPTQLPTFRPGHDHKIPLVQGTKT